MKQLIQSLKDGKVELLDAPSPTLKKGHVLISTSCSAISSGTEKMLIDFGKSNLLNKAISQPDKVSEALNKISTEGLLSTVNAINSKLNSPIALGYSNVGTIISKSDDVEDFQIGDRVVSNGNHAEQVLVPKNLCCKVPDSVSDEFAAFAVIGSIGMQSLRLSSPNYGEKYLVIGLGIIGQITAQLLKSSGCDVFAIDTNKERCLLAAELGINTFHLKSNNEVLSWALNGTSGIGFDGILVAASCNNSKPLKLAAKLARQRGKIILVGSTKIELSRDIFYAKELKFQVSKSYGPGRYDKNYEEKGNDYPISYVRWTEKRNIEAVLRAIEIGDLNIKSLISFKFKFENIVDAYQKLRDDSEKMGIIITYKKNIKITKIIENNFKKKKFKKTEEFNTAVIGCGNYFSRVIIPILKKTELNLHTLVTNTSLSSSFYGRKFNFTRYSSDFESVLHNKNINIVFIGTRHDSHGKLIKKCLEYKKHIFVEKPICLSLKELQSIKDHSFLETTLMVGFNRRFSPIYKKFKEKVNSYSSPKNIIYLCNAGNLPRDHWLIDSQKGGGRMIGEACHFVDLLRDLTGSEINEININKSISKNLFDSFSLNIIFKDGSLASIHYFTNGNKLYPKENIKVFIDNNIYELDNFLTFKYWENNNKSIKRNLKLDKGQKNCIDHFINSIKNSNPEPIPLKEIFEVQEKLLKL